MHGEFQLASLTEWSSSRKIYDSVKGVLVHSVEAKPRSFLNPGCFNYKPPSLEECNTLAAASKFISKQSPCEIEKVGACIAQRRFPLFANRYQNLRIISSAHNGLSGGECLHEVGLRCQPCAEKAAILSTILQQENPLGKTMYTTLSPCFSCSFSIIYFGITEVIFEKYYRDRSGIKLLLQNDIEVYWFRDREEVIPLFVPQFRTQPN